MLRIVKFFEEKTQPAAVDDTCKFLLIPEICKLFHELEGDELANPDIGTRSAKTQPLAYERVSLLGEDLKSPHEHAASKVGLVIKMVFLYFCFIDYFYTKTRPLEEREIQRLS